MNIDLLAAALPQQPAPPAKTPEKQAVQPQAVLPIHTSAPEQPKEPPPTADALQAAVKQIDSYLKGSARTLQFKVDEASGRTVVSVKDANGEVIRQIPNEDVLRLARSLGSSGSKSLLEIEV